MKKNLILISSYVLISCANDHVQARFIEIKNDVARFEIENNSHKDIERICFEITYLDDTAAILLIDTLDYQKSKEYQGDKTPFLKAKDKTFFVQRIPNNSIKAEIKILEIENSDGY